MHEQTTPWELGLGWSISRKKSEFLGSAGLFAAEGKEMVKPSDVSSSEITDLLDVEGTLQSNGEVFGIFTSPGYSHRLCIILGLCHTRPDFAAGTLLQYAAPPVRWMSLSKASPWTTPSNRAHS